MRLARLAAAAAPGCWLVVERAYADKAPSVFTGTVKRAVFDVAPHLDANDEHALHEHAS